MSQSTSSSLPSYRKMLSLWLPMAASIVMMVLEPTIINIGLARSDHAEIALAAYGVAFGMAILIESPVIMLIDASTAKSTGRHAFLVVRRFTVWLGLAVTVIGLLVSFTPLYGLVIEQLMRIPPEVAAETRTTLKVLSLWAFPVGWRRAHQGVLIRAQRTGMITASTVVRLTVLTVVLFAGLRFWPTEGALVAGIAMIASVTSEALLTTLATTRAQREQTAEGMPLEMRELVRFYLPLLVTSVLSHTARPIISTGIASARQAQASLAAWPVILGFVLLITGPAWSLQQLATYMATERSAYRKVARFSAAVSVALALLLGVVGFTPLYNLVLGGVYGLAPPLMELGRLPLQLLVIYPLAVGASSVLRGILIRSARTPSVRAATLVGVGTLVVTLIVGAARLPVSGVLLAASATLIGAFAELLWLFWRDRP